MKQQINNGTRIWGAAATSGEVGSALKAAQRPKQLSARASHGPPVRLTWCLLRAALLLLQLLLLQSQRAASGWSRPPQRCCTLPPGAAAAPTHKRHIFPHAGDHGGEAARGMRTRRGCAVHAGMHSNTVPQLSPAAAPRRAPPQGEARARGRQLQAAASRGRCWRLASLGTRSSAPSRVRRCTWF